MREGIMEYIKVNHYLGKPFTHIHYENWEYMWSVPYDRLEDIKIEGFTLKQLQNERNREHDKTKTKGSKTENGSMRDNSSRV